MNNLIIRGILYKKINNDIKILYPFVKNLGKFTLVLETGKCYKTDSIKNISDSNEIADYEFINDLINSLIKYNKSTPFFYLNMFNKVNGSDGKEFFNDLTDKLIKIKSKKLIY